jgi:hypothetical protein
MNQLKFKEWFAQIIPVNVKEVADKWFRQDGSAKYRIMTEAMIFQTMTSYGLNLDQAAKLVEQAILYYSNEHVCGGPEAYWDLVNRMKNEVGTDAIVGSCKPTADYQVWGACSDKENHGPRRKKRKKHRD